MDRIIGETSKVIPCELCKLRTKNNELNATLKNYRQSVEYLNNKIQRLNNTLRNENDELKKKLSEETQANMSLSITNQNLQRIIDTNDICHNKHGKVDAQAFAEGCAEEQRKLYGVAPHEDKIRVLENNVKTAFESCKFLRRELLLARETIKQQSETLLYYAEKAVVEFDE